MILTILNRFNRDFAPKLLPLFVVGICVVFFYNNALAQSEYWKQRVSFFERFPVKPGDIVFLGNSITDGGEFTEIFNNLRIKNRGINSDVISGVQKRLRQVTDHNPDKVFLLIGINDVSHNLSASEIATQYDSLVMEFKRRAPLSTLYIQSVMPINNDFARYRNLIGKENIIVDLNLHLKEIAEKYDCPFIDLWPVLADEDGKLKKEYTNDGLHLLGTGYDAWSELIHDYVFEKNE